jgi:RimJ/RimL family protein N-acetyltransferase
MSELNLRKVTPKDIKLIFEWANEDTVRENAINKEKILWENHKTWFQKIIISPNTLIFILEEKNIPIGQIRFDKIDNQYEIDYSIDLKYRGRGYGNEIVKKGIEKIKEKYKGFIVAKVKSNNIGSIRVFEKNNFLLVNEEEVGRDKYLVFQLKNLFKNN